ncbi:MAG: zf-HC2 domain-containing protein [Candidatus Aminicenantes bacterium]|nr:zf-HC2 domain-containing protein [Candidatus Aminicenantes bacterium]
MRKCKFEDFIDGYLLNRLSERDKEAFEEHYFNCSSCFEKLQERDVIIRTIKNHPELLITEKTEARVPLLATLKKEVRAFFTPRQLVLAGLTALLVLVVIFVIVPRNQAPAPNFFLTDEETVRGSSITLISPVIDMNQIPSSFEWKKLGENIEYQVSIFNHQLLWKATTKENRITLPEEVKAKMVPGEKYSWQVKAFSPDGTLIAVSSRVQFKIAAQ